MSAIDNFTVCALLYGDFPVLAHRCLSSLPQTEEFKQHTLRVGMNAVSDRTAAIVERHGASQVWRYSENLHKYPVMREMIHGISPVKTPYLMWFDDDSYLDGVDHDAWFADVDHRMQTADVLGSLYVIKWQGQQREFVKAQPWYTGHDPALREQIKFATGGWWTIRTELLYRYDYPWSCLDHCGGDSLLGELCLQQGLRLQAFNHGVKINADGQGRESKATRRGFSQKPIGVQWAPDAADTLNQATTRHAADI